VTRDPRLGEAALLNEHGENCGEQPGIAAGPDLKMEVGHLRRLAPPRIDHDQASLRVPRDLPQRDARAREAMGEPGILAEEDGDLAVLEVAAREGAGHLRRDPGLARLLLGERVRAMARADGRPQRTRIAGREMVALPAAPVVEDRLPAVQVADRSEPLRDLADRRAPVDRLEASVRPATKGRRQPIGVVLVVVETRRLLAGIPRRARMGLVAADPPEPTAVDAAELDLDSAVALAEDAGARAPGRRDFGGGHGHASPDGDSAAKHASSLAPGGA
jgi:hypothetical protein